MGTLRMMKFCKYASLITSLLLLCTLYLALHSIGLSQKLLHQPCVLPNLDIYDSSLDDAFYRVQPVNCHVFNPLVYLDSNDILQLNDSAVNQSLFRNLRCVASILQWNGHNDVKLKPIETELPIQMSDDFASVKCYSRGGVVVYHDLFYTINREETLKNIKRDILNESSKHLNIIILGFDSVSALAFKRLMPLTMQYLRSELGAYIMEGYTKIGTNTLPNLLAVLTGKTILESLVPSMDYPLLYKQILANGYIDSYIEDRADFLPPSFGFTIPKYTHSTRRLMLANKYSKGFLKHPISNKFDIDDQLMCFKNKLKHTFVLDYASKFIQKYKRERKYLFIWSIEAAHSETNYLQLFDKETLNFIKELQESGSLRNTFFVVLSDHGPSRGKTLWSDVGRLSAKMPMLALVVPRHILSQHPHVHQNLMTNTQRLTTHFDFHETIMDILTDKVKINDPIDQKYNLPRGISLFKEIPETRSCYEASISEHFCPCATYSSTDVNMTAVSDSAKVIVNEINLMLKIVSDVCRSLTLASVKSAKIKQFANIGHKYNKEKSFSYVIVLETKPGKGIFESTVEYFNRRNIKLIGPIERINTYGDQSICIANTHERLKPYCFCK